MSRCVGPHDLRQFRTRPHPDVLHVGLQMPFALLEAALFSLIVYFWVGYESSASCFLLFYFILVCAILMQSCMFRMLACICPNMVLANAGGSVLLLILIVSSGFVLVRSSIPG